MLREDATVRPDGSAEARERRRPGSPRSEEVWVFEGVAVGTEDDEGRIPTGRAAPTRRAPGTTRRAPGTTGERPSPASRSQDEDLPSDVVDELTVAVGRTKAQKLAQRMASAVRAYERDRYPEAMRITRLLADDVPESAAVRELHGLVCYRSGRWRDAVKHLTAARSLAGDDPSQVPVLMDCHRAMGHHRRVEALWDELRSASAPADVLVEGRLVMAEDLAEQDRLDDAIALVASAGGARNLRHPGDRHVRQWYVLADLYERAGDVPRARELFGRVVAADPDVADAADRLAALGRPRRTGRPARTTAGARASTGTRSSGGAPGRTAAGRKAAAPPG